MSLDEKKQKKQQKAVLIFSIFIAGVCSIIYELLISTTASYFQGDSIKQFSITIGIYMAAMGLGSFLSRLIKTSLLQRFIQAEIVLALIGGSAVPFMYLFFIYMDSWGFQFMMILLILVIGILIGLEIPLITRIMKEYYPLKINLSNVLSVDYFGALAATLLFPFLLLPFVGVFRSSLIFGLINLSIGFINLWYFAPVVKIKRKSVYWISLFGVLAYFCLMLFFADKLMGGWNSKIFRNPIIYNEQTQYQNLTLTKGGDIISLYIDRVIQWSSTDEHRYHESLVHIPMAQSDTIKSVLVLGGGEGLALREVLKYPQVQNVDIVDLDKGVFELAIKNPFLLEINQSSLLDPRVHRIPEDAFKFLKTSQKTYDLIISDLPDPLNESLSRLYSKSFFNMCYYHLNPDGLFVTQATSPFDTPNAFWCIEQTLEASLFGQATPYHTLVPSFGDWGFIMASQNQTLTLVASPQFPMDSKYLTQELYPHLFYFSKDQKKRKVQVNTLDNPKLLNYFLKDWKRWNYSSTNI